MFKYLPYYWNIFLLLTFFLKMIRRLFPFVAMDLFAPVDLCRDGFILLLFRTRSTTWLVEELLFVFPPPFLPVIISVGASTFTPTVAPPICFRPQELHRTSSWGPFLHIVETVVLHVKHTGRTPRGISTQLTNLLRFKNDFNHKIYSSIKW